MTSFTIESLRAAVEGTPLSEWEDAVTTITQQRAAVGEFLRAGGHAYGFSTFLGHLDKFAVEEAQNLDIFHAHLVGSPQELNAREMTAITVMKLCQAAQGGSGLSPEAYQQLREFHAHPREGRVDLQASYGSGDVVPAAWWTNSVFQLELTAHDARSVFRSGDVIALINGSFIPQGFILAHLAELEEAFATTTTLLQEAHAIIGASDVQLSVSLRDLGPLEHALSDALSRLTAALSASASRTSANPRFVFGADGPSGTRAESNASFLDFTFTSALEQYASAMVVASAYLRSATWWVSQHGELRDGEVGHGVYFVQPPKISKAYYDRLTAALSSAPPVVQAESNEVEDIGDGALHRAHTIVSALPLLLTQQRLLATALTAVRGPAGQRPRFEV